MMFEDFDKISLKEMIFQKVINNINIVYFCKKCHCRIPTVWIDGMIDGHFMVIGSITSELFIQYHADPLDILCIKCFYNLP